MNLRHRASLVLILGLILGLALLGRELLRPEDTGHAPPSSDNVATVADPSVPAATPTVTQSASTPDVTPAPNVSSATGTFRGRVIDAATRQPVREFTVEFHPMHKPEPGDVPPGVRAFLTKDGRFELKGIPPRLWMVTTKARGYQRFDLDQLLIQAGTATEVVMPLQRGHSLRGRVYDHTSGAGIASASIVVREAHVGRYEGNFRMRVRTTTAKDGSFVLDGVPAGTLILTVNVPKYTPREVDAVVDGKTSPLQIGLSIGGVAAGHLVAADGATPVAGAVSILHLDEGYSNSDRSNDAGEFKFERLPAGRYRIVARSGGQRAEREFSLATDERKDGLVLALSAAGQSIRGAITGLPTPLLDRVRVRAEREGSFFEIGETSVNAVGTYEIPGVEAGEVVLTAVAMGRQITKRVQVPPDADVTVNFEFAQGARLTGNVTRGGQPVANVWLTPHSVKPQKVFIHGTQTSAKGEYVIAGVPNGEYVMVIDSYRSRNFEVSGDTVVDIDVPVGRFSGRTVEEGAKVPVVGVDVRLWSIQRESDVAYWEEHSNHFGEFAIAGLEPGDYMLSAYKPGYEMYRERISYGSATDAVTIGLRRGNGVTIRLQEAGTARPIRNAQVLESIGGRPGVGLRLHLDESGVGYVPSALAGSTLTFRARFYAPAVISDWNGQELEVQLQKQLER